jgi:hypothetical protein
MTPRMKKVTSPRRAGSGRIGAYRTGWSRYTRTANKDYSVMGIVVVRNTIAPARDLMEAAKALKADDSINVRIDAKKEKRGKKTILAVSAAAIEYKDASL